MRLRSGYHSFFKMQSLFGHPSASAEAQANNSSSGSGVPGSLLRPPVPERAARRLFCPAVFSYAKLTKWPGNMDLLARDRKYTETAVRRMNKLLEGVGVLRAQRVGVVESPFCKLWVFESPPDSSSALEANFSTSDALKVGGLVLSQLNAIIRAAREPLGETDGSVLGDEAPLTSASGEEAFFKPTGCDADAEKEKTGSPSTSARSSLETAAVPLLTVQGAERYILYLHGGAYISQSPVFYRIFLHDLSRLTGARIVAPRYALAPEKLFPTQIETAFAVYRHLLRDCGVDPNKLICAGDSAGGNLAVSLMMRVIDYNRSVKTEAEKLPLPKAVLLLSPWLDLSTQGPSYTFNRRAEPLLPLECIRRAAVLYVQGDSAFGRKGTDPMPRAVHSPWVSPVYLSDPDVLKAMPETLIHAGSAEVLLSDSLIYARRLNEAASLNCKEDLPEQEALPPFPVSNVEVTSASESSDVKAGSPEAPTAASTSSKEGGSLGSQSGSQHFLPGAVPLRHPLSCDWGASEEAPEEEASQQSFFPTLDLFAALKNPFLARTAEAHAETELEAPSVLEPALPTPLYFSRLGTLSQVERDLITTLRKAEVAGDVYLSEDKEAASESGKGATNSTEKEEKKDESEPKKKSHHPKASLWVWDDEFHVFATFGFLEEPAASECIKCIAKWINQKFDDSPKP